MSTGAHPLVDATPPAWATCWGDAEFGPWAGFMENHVVYKMFWIPPGRFTMGSPETEVPRPGGDEIPEAFSEHPHEVTLTRGFWLAEWPCIQDLWTAVMGENPSRFKDRWRPVEQVSWDEVQDFLRRINERQPGLALRLPTEAEWEYACRAGTASATYAGELTRWAPDAPVLDDIAWYDGNSGIDYDREEGHEWDEQWHATQVAGTRRVGLRTPNGWGLHDVLGNVLEWCQDWAAPYSSEAQIDPQGPAEGGFRVFRGGWWDGDARYCRAANRDADPPSDAYGPLGFRFARDQAAPGGGPEGPGPTGAEPR